MSEINNTNSVAKRLQKTIEADGKSRNTIESNLKCTTIKPASKPWALPKIKAPINISDIETPAGPKGSIEIKPSFLDKKIVPKVKEIRKLMVTQESKNSGIIVTTVESLKSKNTLVLNANVGIFV